MYKKLIAAAAIAVAAAAVAGLATAGGAATQQRIAFVYARNASKMTLTPLTSGPVLGDSGHTSWCCWTEKFVHQDGESIAIDDPFATFVGKRGSLTWRERISWLNPGNGYSVTTGTWRVVRGTGAYEHLTGHGHLAFISDAGNKVLTYRAVGLVDLSR